ncbi:hypothetical protein HanIR_Chr09g0446961 [Helianthus annuus]|nr:hypothetical protein HanIR_Chr09g0446961 [Helianthus annuus]
MNSGGGGSNEGDVSICDAEILDEFTTSRGELKVRSLSIKDDRRTQVTIMSVSDPNLPLKKQLLLLFNVINNIYF